ncbi:G5 domain-containing protein, partial [Streptococcus infantis]|uniref:G5 domain-containing protein n=1 Tax=Streptococcus infantis TaxID=68892 RepID=UPI0039C28716
KVESSVQPLDGSGNLVLEKLELEVKEEAVAFNHQERPTADLLLGERRVVQAGEAGQVRHLIEIDAKGHRTLLKTEVVKEAVAEITEVGTRVESSVQPLDGSGNLVLEKLELEVKEEAVAFNHQERPTADLLLGERRLVQAGEAGQIRHLIEVDAKGHRTLLKTEVVKEAVAEITEVGTKVESRVEPLEGPKVLEVKKPSLVVEEEVLAFGREERENSNLSAGERRLVQAGVEGLRRNLVEVDAEGKRSLKGTELVKEAVAEIVEIGPKVDVQDDKPLAPAPVVQAAKQEPAKAEAQAEKPEGKQLPSTGEEVDTNLLALGLVGVLGGFGLLAQKKKEE